MYANSISLMCSTTELFDMFDVVSIEDFDVVSIEVFDVDLVVCLFRFC